MTGASTLELPIPIGYFRLILRCFGTTPERKAAVLTGTGVSELALLDPATVITVAQQLRQNANVGALAGPAWTLDPDFKTVQGHGAIGIAALSAPDMGSAIAVLAQLTQVHAPFSRLYLHQHARDLELEFRVDKALAEADWRPLMEIGLLGFFGVVSALLGRPAIGARSSFACQPPVHADAMRTALGGDVTYNATCNSMMIPRDWSRIASPFADPTLFAATTASLQSAMLRLNPPLTVREQVEVLVATMPDGRLTASEAAGQLGLSLRTMVRRLTQSGTSFRVLLDAELRRRAQSLLMAGGLSHAEIAERLGYEDATSFSRAYRRWAAYGTGDGNLF